jgi:hypothetical protein
MNTAVRAMGKGGESLSEVACGIAVEVPLAGESEPTGEDGEGDDCAGAEGSIRTRASFRRMGVAEVVHHDVKCGEEGVHVKYAEPVPFPSGNGIGKPTLIRGHLPLNFRPNNSHQAFEVVSERGAQGDGQQHHGECLS